MKKKILILLVCCGLATTLSGALPPAFQNLREYKALIESPRFADLLESAESIQSITRDDTGFIIKTSRRVIHVDVVQDPADHPGPIKFHLVFPS